MNTPENKNDGSRTSFGDSVKKFWNHHGAFGPAAWKGAASTVAAVILLFWFGMLLSAPPSGIRDWMQTLLFLSLAAGASFLLGNFIITLLAKARTIPDQFRWVVVGAVFLMFNMLNPLFSQMFNVLLIISYLIIFSTLLGAGIGRLSSHEGSKFGSSVLTALGAAGIIAVAIWFIWPGPANEAAHDTLVSTGTASFDPFASSGYSVGTLTYGSGIDRHRSEYSTDAQIITAPIDVTPLVQQGSGIAQLLRKSFWGFDLASAPLNGRVWYPQGEGPFPLVLMVHGNHSMFDFSDPGYEYLGTFFAERGCITVSVDQNFLNGGGIAEILLGEITQENDARGYLLLEHLRLWHDWNTSPGHIFEAKVDTDNILLIGHSRGGEAAAAAALFNSLPVHPDNAMIPFDYGYSIRGVAAVAPSDGQYLPRRQKTALKDVSYLVLQGSADSDVRSFAGSKQYDRVSFSDGASGFKASVYIEGANHGYFNSRWGMIDQPAASWLINRGSLMDEKIQQRAAQMYIGGFIEAVLFDRREFEELFLHGQLGNQWIRELSVLVQYRSAETEILADFSEDMNLHTAAKEGSVISASQLPLWKEEAPHLGSKDSRDTVSARIGWNSLKQHAWTLEFPEKLNLSAEKLLVFDIAHAAESAEPLDLTVEITDAAGSSAALPIGAVRKLPPSFTYRMYKPPLQVSFTSEPVFSTYGLLPADFLPDNSPVSLEELVKISFNFDRTPKGDIYLDNIGIQNTRIY